MSQRSSFGAKLTALSKEQSQQYRKMIEGKFLSKSKDVKQEIARMAKLNLEKQHYFVEIKHKRFRSPVQRWQP